MADGDGGNQQQQGAGSGQGGSGQQQGGLLDSEAENGGDGGEQQGQQQGGQQQQGQGGGGGAPPDLSQVLQRFDSLQQSLTSEIDRRVNGLASTLRREMQGQGQQQGQQGGGQQQGQQQAPPQQVVVSGPSAGDVQEARSTARNYLNDEVKFLGAAERAFAEDLASALIHSGLQTEGVSPDGVGRAVATQVAERVKAVRKMYETRTIAALERKGRLMPEQTQGGQPVYTPGATTAPAGSPTSATHQAAAARAREMYQDRLPAGSKT